MPTTLIQSQMNHQSWIRHLAIPMMRDHPGFTPQAMNTAQMFSILRTARMSHMESVKDRHLWNARAKIPLRKTPAGKFFCLLALKPMQFKLWRRFVFNLSRPATIPASSTLMGLLTSRVSVLMMEAVGEDLDQDAKGTPHIPKPSF